MKVCFELIKSKNMKFTVFFFLIFSTILFGQNILPDLNLASSIDIKNYSEENDVKNLLKLKNDEIAVSFYTNGGLGYHLNIDNFIFNQDGDVKHNREEIYYKNGKKHKKRRIFVSDLQKESLKKIIHSDFFFDFVKYTQNDFKYSENNHQICSGSMIDDAPENFIMITQNKRSNNIMVYLPINNMKCSDEDSPLMKFVKLHQLFNIELDR